MRVRTVCGATLLKFYVSNVCPSYIYLDDIVFFLFVLLKHLFVSDFTGGALSFVCGVRIDFARGAYVFVIECVSG